MKDLRDLNDNIANKLAEIAKYEREVGKDTNGAMQSKVDALVTQGVWVGCVCADVYSHVLRSN